MEVTVTERRRRDRVDRVVGSAGLLVPRLCFGLLLAYAVPIALTNLEARPRRPAARALVVSFVAFAGSLTVL